MRQEISENKVEWSHFHMNGQILQILEISERIKEAVGTEALKLCFSE